MILSYKTIDEIATSVFKKISTGTESELEIIPIEDIAENHLKLKISYTKLSDNGRVLGLTTYADTKCKLKIDGQEQIIELKSKQILLDEIFTHPKTKQELLGKHRFTLAHEVAHQILFGLESVQNKAKYEKLYSTRTSYSVRELKTNEDWNEWQANVLGAALLMPIEKVRLLMWYLYCGKPLTNYEGWFDFKEKQALKCFCDHFGVSKTAAIIRLRQLGYIVDKRHCEYVDPLEVQYEEF